MLLRAEQLDLSDADAHYRHTRLCSALGDENKAATE